MIQQAGGVQYPIFWKVLAVTQKQCIFNLGTLIKSAKHNLALLVSAKFLSYSLFFSTKFILILR